MRKYITRMDLTERCGLEKLYMSIHAVDSTRLNLSLEAKESEKVILCAQICMII